MPPHELIKLLKHILPWIPQINESIRAEIQGIIDQLQAQLRQ